MAHPRTFCVCFCQCLRGCVLPGLAPYYQKALDKLESMSTELNSMNPGFTVRRQLDEIRKESEQIEYLRNVGV